MSPGEQLRVYFESLNLTMQAFAQKLGTNRVSLRHWLAGTGFPRNEFCEKIYSLTGIESFSPEKREEARKQFEAGIPAQVRKARKEKYDANPEVYRARGMASYHKRYEAQREFVDSLEEREALLNDPRKDKNICRICWQKNLTDIGPHLGQVHHISVDVYKEKFEFLRSRNATRSEATQAKQSAAMKRGKHQPPKWTHELLPLAQKASLKTNVPGSARLEKRLTLRGKVLGERPQFWKRSEDGDVVSDAKIARLRLERGMSLEKIAERVSMTPTPVFFRLKRMGFPRKARLFQHGEPVTGKSFASLVYDFNLTVEEAAERVGISLDWARRLVRGRGEWLSHDVAQGVVRARKELLRVFREKPTTGEKGVGRPRRVPAADEHRMLARYDGLQTDLKSLRAWIRGQEQAPSITAIWDWLCRSWRRRRLRSLQFSPQFFAWVEKNYLDPTFRNGSWVPNEVARAFVAFEFGVKEDFVRHILTDRSPSTAEK